MSFPLRQEPGLAIPAGKPPALGSPRNLRLTPIMNRARTRFRATLGRLRAASALRAFNPFRRVRRVQVDTPQIGRMNQKTFSESFSETFSKRVINSSHEQ
jgi:hypothetical protein